MKMLMLVGLSVLASVSLAGACEFKTTTLAATSTTEVAMTEQMATPVSQEQKADQLKALEDGRVVLPAARLSRRGSERSATVCTGPRAGPGHLRVLSFAPRVPARQPAKAPASAAGRAVSEARLHIERRRSIRIGDKKVDIVAGVGDNCDKPRNDDACPCQAEADGERYHQGELSCVAAKSVPCQAHAKRKGDEEGDCPHAKDVLRNRPFQFHRSPSRPKRVARAH